MQTRSPGSAADAILQRGHLVVGEELRDRALDLAVAGERDPRQALGARVDGGLVERVDAAAAPVARALGVERLDRAAGRQRAREHLELAGREDRRHVDELQTEARVGAVGAEALHRVVRT